MADTIGSALRRATTRLQPQSDTPELDARFLLACTLDVTTTRLYTKAQSRLATADLQRFENLIDRRAAGEPVAYITGVCGFWNLELNVNPNVLIPRPDTETLVETALETLPDTACSVVDLGTGSGAIALALASERPQWSVTATDSSPQALACARDNAEKNALRNVDFLPGHWFEAVAGMRFDAIVSNPPYVAEDDEHLQAPELGFEPSQALVSADHGLADLAQIAENAAQHLNSDGWLMLEHGFEQGEAVRALLRDAGLDNIETRPDLAGRERVTLGTLASNG